jgi:hypothetical protein
MFIITVSFLIAVIQSDAITTVTLPSEIKGGGLSALTSVYNGTVSETTSEVSFYVKYNVSSYGFVAIMISPNDQYVDVYTSVTGNRLETITYDRLSVIYGQTLVTPTEADCENPNESTDGGVNCLFLVTISFSWETSSSVSFETYGYVGQIVPVSNGTMTPYSIPKGYSMFYLVDCYGEYDSGEDYFSWYSYNITVQPQTTSDLFAVYVYPDDGLTSIYDSYTTYTSSERTFEYASMNFIFQVVASSSSNADSSFNFSIIRNSYTQYYSDSDSGHDDTLSAKTIIGIVFGAIFGLLTYNCWNLVSAQGKKLYLH